MSRTGASAKTWLSPLATATVSHRPRLRGTEVAEMTSASPPLDCSFPLVFEPRLKTQVWGGRQLELRLGKSLPTSELYGEAWEICPLAGHVSVATGPLWGGVPLDELWSRHPTWRGPRLQSAGQFPWLIKWLDCWDRLSVQVHPDAASAVRLAGRCQPKNEVWIIVHAEPTARVWAGCRPSVTAEELGRRIDDGTVVECLHEFAPQRGDCIYLPAGTLHAAGGGLLMAEIQQPSDITFRLFDWNRPGLDGKPRELHREAGLAALHWPQLPVDPIIPQPHAESTDACRGERLLSSPEFQLERWTVSSTCTRETDEFAVWMVLGGRGRLTCGNYAQSLAAGQTLWFPAVPTKVTWQVDGDEPLELLRVTPAAE
jgi:mannose-6-phosphate isomerase